MKYIMRLNLLLLKKGDFERFLSKVHKYMLEIVLFKHNWYYFWSVNTFKYQVVLIQRKINLNACKPTLICINCYWTLISTF